MKYYGQFSPPLDKLLYERYFLNKHSGFFLECGATDGVTESTCKFFEESMKWTGINIEPVPFLFERLIRNRPKAHNLSIALSDRDGKATFTHAVHPLHGWLFGNGSLKHSEAHLDDLLTQGCSFSQFEVTTMTYPTMLKQVSPNSVLPALDLMILDVEGHELQVVSAMRDASVLPTVFCVESTISDSEALRSAVEALGYHFDITMHNNSVFLRN